MKIAAIIAEYNPFHKGHRYQLERTRARDGANASHVVAVLNGNFMQRGEPAILPKSDRVRMALANGVDLVIELPLPWGLSSAESFAFGAVSLLNAMGCVDVLSFGSESGDAAALQKAADVMDNEHFGELLRYYLTGGNSYPDARQKALREIAGDTTAALLSSPNNTLGIEYLRAIKRVGASLEPYTIPRFGSSHDASMPVDGIASASYLRTLLRGGRMANAAAFLPQESAAILNEAAREQRCPSDVSRLDRGILAALRDKTPEYFAGLPRVSEGLENRLYKMVREAGSYEELVATVKTKRYPQTRIQRLIWSAFLGVDDHWHRETPPYIRVLGVGDRGSEVLAQCRNATLPLFTRTAQIDSLSEEAQKLFALECRAADLYGLMLPKAGPCGTEQAAGMLRTK